MNIFCVVGSNHDYFFDKWEILLAKHGHSLVPMKEPVFRTWKSGNKKLRIYSWLKDRTPYSAEDFLHINNANDINMFNGWIVPDSGSSSLDALHYAPYFNHEIADPPNNLFGEYIFISLTNNGNGVCVRNNLCIMPLYLSETNEGFIISNRASIAALFQNHSPVFEYDDMFCGMLCGFTWPLCENTLFKGVKALPSGSRITFKNGILNVSRQLKDALYDEELKNLFKMDHYCPVNPGIDSAG